MNPKRNIILFDVYGLASSVPTLTAANFTKPNLDGTTIEAVVQKHEGNYVKNALGHSPDITASTNVNVDLSYVMNLGEDVADVDWIKLIQAACIQVEQDIEKFIISPLPGEPAVHAVLHFFEAVSNVNAFKLIAQRIMFGGVNIVANGNEVPMINFTGGLGTYVSRELTEAITVIDHSYTKHKTTPSFRPVFAIGADEAWKCHSMEMNIENSIVQKIDGVVSEGFGNCDITDQNTIVNFSLYLDKAKDHLRDVMKVGDVLEDISIKWTNSAGLGIEIDLGMVQLSECELTHDNNIYSYQCVGKVIDNSWSMVVDKLPEEV